MHFMQSLETDLFLYPRKTSENQRFSDVFRGTEIDQWHEMRQSIASDIFLSLQKAGSKAPTFTDLAELVSQIRPPGTVSQATLAKISRVFDYYSDEDISDNDEMDFRERGVMSDQELMPESDLMSGTEELGYEVC